MVTLKDFIAALEAGWFVALTVLVGATIILAGDYWQIPYLDKSPGWLLTAAVVAAVFSFSVLVANIAYIPVKIWKWGQRKKARKMFREKIAREIENAPPQELAVLAYLVQSGRQAFNAEFNDRRLSPLVSKGLIIKLSGSHSILEWPYLVRQEVWDFLVENKEQLRIPMPADGRDPFDWRI